MKNIIVLFVGVSVLSVLDAHESSNGIRERNRSMYNRCFNAFNPIIHPLSSDLRKASQRCITLANHQKNTELQLLKSSRLEMFEEVQRFKDSVKNCTTSAEHQTYSECLNRVIRIDREIVDRISSRFDSSTERKRQIEYDKRNCLQTAVNRSKDKTSQAFSNLESCLSNIRN